MSYMFARIQLRYGRAEQFTEIMGHLVPVLERLGWRLLGAYETTLGTLHEVWDVWEMDDANASQSVLAAALADPEFAEWAARLPEVVETEELRFLRKMPYSP
jgi:NIPSNAP protein